jgi:hypothetical protein
MTTSIQSDDELDVKRETRAISLLLLIVWRVPIFKL